MRVLFSLATVFFISACDINEDMRSLSANKGDSDARTIAASNGCMGCHAVSNKVVGPAWKRVSEHYKNTANAKELLIAKIKSGGNGNWKSATSRAIRITEYWRLSRLEVSSTLIRASSRSSCSLISCVFSNSYFVC